VPITTPEPDEVSAFNVIKAGFVGGGSGGRGWCAPVPVPEPLGRPGLRSFAMLSDPLPTRPRVSLFGLQGEKRLAEEQARKISSDLEPLDYMLGVMRNPTADQTRRGLQQNRVRRVPIVEWPVEKFGLYIMTNLMRNGR
jgi:hypothetical protein